MGNAYSGRVRHTAEHDQKFGELRREMQTQGDALRAELNRQTTTLNAMLFDHRERIAKIETRLENKQ
jgi:hypothetical protein